MYYNLIFKTITLYFFIVLAYRIMGKKEVGQLGVIDLIVSFLIAELAAISIENNNVSILTSIVSITTLVLLQILLSYINIKSYKLRRIIDGEPSILIKKGKINYTIMQKLRYSIDDLLSQIREKDIKNINDINYAVLENNGKLSIFQDNNDYPLPLIIEGKIDKNTLQSIGKSNIWLNNILNQKNIKLKDIYYAFYSNTKVVIITYNDLL